MSGLKFSELGECSWIYIATTLMGCISGVASHGGKVGDDRKSIWIDIEEHECGVIMPCM